MAAPAEARTWAAAEPAFAVGAYRQRAVVELAAEAAGERERPPERAA